MSKVMHVLTISLGVLLAISACRTPTVPEGERVVGILAVQGGAQGDRSLLEQGLQAEGIPSSRVSVPDTVQAGVPFTATITTIGWDSCWKAAGAEVDPGEGLAVVVPYDSIVTRFNGDVAGCLTANVDLPRDVQVTFTRRGNATLRVIGRRVLGPDPRNAEEMTVEKSVFVR